MSADIHFILGQSQGSLDLTNDATADATLADWNAFAYPASTAGITETSYDFGIYNASATGWTWFAKRWTELTGRRVVFVTSNIGGTGLLQAAAAGNGYWDYRDGGNLYDGAATTMSAFDAVLSRSPLLKNARRFIHWNQGSSDALAVNGTTVTGALYQEALGLLATKAKTDFRASHFCIWETGYRNGVSADDDKYAEIRAAQNAVLSSSNVMIWDKAKLPAPLVVDGSGNWVSGAAYVDQYHHTGEYNKAAGIGAAEVLAGLL